MNSIKAFLKATIVGGLIFLVPVVLLLVVLRHAMQFAGKIARPIAAAFPISEVAGVTLTTLVAVLVLLLVAFLAGLVARSDIGRRLTLWFEQSMFGSMPQYQMVKSMAEGFAKIESGTGMQPVLMRGDEGWQLGYRLEDLPGGWVAVFLPASPTPMSGNVMYVAADRVKSLDIPMADAMRIVKRVGLGSTEALRGVDLGPPQ